jgi:hypothetical protein
MKSPLACVQFPQSDPVTTVPATIIVVVVLVLAALLGAVGMPPAVVGATLTAGGISAAATLNRMHIKIALPAR